MTRDACLSDSYNSDSDCFSSLAYKYIATGTPKSSFAVKSHKLGNIKVASFLCVLNIVLDISIIYRYIYLFDSGVDREIAVYVPKSERTIV